MKLLYSYRFFFLFFLLSYTSELVAVNTAGSFSQTTILTVKSDSAEVQLLMEAAKKMEHQNPDSAIRLYKKALSLAERIGWNQGIVNCYEKLGIVYGIRGDDEQSMQLFTRAVKVLELMMKSVPHDEQKEHKLQQLKQEKKSALLGKQGNYPKAIDFYLKLLDEAKQEKNKEQIVEQSENVAKVYFDEPNFSKSLEYLFNLVALDLEMKNQQNSAKHFATIGRVYLKMGNYDEALYYSLKANELSKKFGFKNAFEESLLNISGIYFEWFLKEKMLSLRTEYLSKALEYTTSSLAIARKNENSERVSIALYRLGVLNTWSKNYAQGGDLLKQSLELASRIASPQMQKENLKALSDLYEAQGNTVEALQLYKKATQLRDSLFNEEKEKQLTRREMNSEFDKREALAKAEQDKKDAIVKQEGQKQKNILWMVAGILSLVLIFSLFIFRSLQVTRKQNKLIELKKSEVEEQKIVIEKKSKEILDSINYAVRIQQAKLPRKSIIYENLKQSFVLFMPKDRVSGDFYFYFKKEDGIYLAAADCTGHGIPGAFMSMVGSEKLFEGVSRRSDVSAILDLMNTGIKASLRQTDESSSIRDGMDIALCKLYPVSAIASQSGLRLQYAGANRPLWIIRKDATEIEEIKSTKTAIAGHTPDGQHFEAHEIGMNKGDTFYIFSDGYADTFGKKNKKLTTKKLKQILVDIQQLSMKEQETYLTDFIVDWKGDVEQVDDILFIGVRV